MCAGQLLILTLCIIMTSLLLMSLLHAELLTNQRRKQVLIQNAAPAMLAFLFFHLKSLFTILPYFNGTEVHRHLKHG